MSEYKSAVGPIPDEWFENDSGPDPKYKKMQPAGFLDGFLASLQKDKSAPAPPSEQSDSSRLEVSRDHSRR